MPRLSLPKLFGFQLLFLTAALSGIIVSFVVVTNDVVNDVVSSAVRNAMASGFSEIRGKVFPVETLVRLLARRIATLDDHFDESLSVERSRDALTAQTLNMEVVPGVSYVYYDYQSGTNDTEWGELNAGVNAQYPSGFSCFTAYPNGSTWILDGAAPLNMTNAVETDPYHTSSFEYLSVIAGIDQSFATSGYWHPPAYFFDPDTRVETFLQTFTMPLAFNAASGLCSRAISMDIDISWLRNVLKSLETGGGFLHLIDARQRQLVASSLPFPPYTAAFKPYAMTATPDARINAAAARLLQVATNGSVAFSDGTVAYETADDWIVTSAQLRSGSLHWALTDHTPRDFYFARPRRLRTILITVAVVVSCVTFFVQVGVWLSVSRPLARISERMEAAAVLSDNEPEDAPSAFVEMGALQAAYYRMRAKLNELRSFVPKTQLLTVDADDDDDEDETLHGDHEIDSRGVGDRRASQDSLCPPSETESIMSQSVASISATTDTPGTQAHPPRGGRRHGHDRRSASGLSSDYSVGSRRGVGGAVIARSFAHLVEKAVAVLVVNATGFHVASQRFGVRHELLARLHAQFTDIVERAVFSHKGVVDDFVGDHFFCTFNASRPAAMFGKRAALAALDAVQAVHTQFNSDARDSNSAEDLVVVGVSCGVAAGRCLVGNLGSETMKRFCCVGPAFCDAVALEREVRAHRGVSILASHGLMADIEHEVYYQVVGLRVVRSSFRPALPQFPHQQPQQQVSRRLFERVLAVMSRKDTTEDESGEWMYSLSTGESRDPFGLVNKAFAALVKGDPVAADVWIEELRGIATKHGADGHAARFRAGLDGLEHWRLALREECEAGGPVVCGDGAAPRVTFIHGFDECDELLA